jgi:glutathione S-transferase
MLEEVGRPYDTVVVPYGPEMKTPECLALNSMGKVPTLLHGDTVVTETPAILAYLADAFPQAGLTPPPAERGAYYRWLFFAAGPMEAAVTNQALGVKVEAKQQGFVGYGNALLTEDTLAAALAGRRFIAGDRFSAADTCAQSSTSRWSSATCPSGPSFWPIAPRMRSARPSCARRLWTMRRSRADGAGCSRASVAEPSLALGAQRSHCHDVIEGIVGV